MASEVVILCLFLWPFWPLRPSKARTRRKASFKSPKVRQIAIDFIFRNMLCVKIYTFFALESQLLLLGVVVEASLLLLGTFVLAIQLRFMGLFRALLVENLRILTSLFPFSENCHKSFSWKMQMIRFIFNTTLFSFLFYLSLKLQFLSKTPDTLKWSPQSP